ncbi:MAG TPA: M23 family metallopeptidase, partial [Baekduia sp.]|nr:M23 family metallopeptidase [Baekduia sp.]
MSSSTHRRRAALALVLPAALAFASAPAAHAAGPRPDFKMPVPCAQTWDATTYENHGPNPNSIDLAPWDGKTNISLGEPVLASAAGTVSDVGINGKSENYVFLDHGGGWTTEHKHLESIPPLKVGQVVAQGQEIGRTGASGDADMSKDGIQPIAPHIHYTQKSDGKAVRVAFDGALINTHAENLNSYNTWPGGGEKLTSTNCPGNAFLPFTQDGQRHMLAYQPGTGASGIVRVADNGIATNVWSGPIGRRWTALAPFTVNGAPHLLRYAAATGAVEFSRVAAGAKGLTKLSSGTWDKGWTHFVPLTLGTTSYVLGYSQLFGGVNIDRINATGTGTTTVLHTGWTQGWTSVEPFRLNGNQYVALYKRANGELKILKVSGSGNDVALSVVHAGSLPAGMSHVVALVQNGAGTLLGYDPSTGVARFQKFSPTAVPYATAVATAQWTKGWTSFTVYTA